MQYSAVLPSHPSNELLIDFSSTQKIDSYCPCAVHAKVIAACISESRYTLYVGMAQKCILNSLQVGGHFSGASQPTQKATKVAHKVQLTVYREAKKLSETQGQAPLVMRPDHTFWLTSSLWKGRKRRCCIQLLIATLKNTENQIHVAYFLFPFHGKQKNRIQKRPLVCVLLAHPSFVPAPSTRKPHMALFTILCILQNDNKMQKACGLFFPHLYQHIGSEKIKVLFIFHLSTVHWN